MAFISSKFEVDDCSHRWAIYVKIKMQTDRWAAFQYSEPVNVDN